MHVMAEQIKDISTYLIKALKVLLYLSDSDTEMLFYLLFAAIAINEIYYSGFMKLSNSLVVCTVVEESCTVL